MKNLDCLRKQKQSQQTVSLFHKFTGSASLRLALRLSVWLFSNLKFNLESLFHYYFNMLTTST